MLPNSTIKLGLTAACVVCLSACGGSTSPPVDVAPVTQSVGPDNIGLAFNSSGILTQVLINGVNQFLISDSGAAHGQVSAFNSSDVFASIADTGNSYFYASATNGATVPHGTVAYIRQNTTSFPTAGGASYIGDYAGFLRQDSTPTNSVTHRIRGDLALTANFGASSVSGAITNRALHIVGTNMLDLSNATMDVALGAAPIDAAGAFTGATSGGILVNGVSWAPPVGTYSGLISGATGNEVVGGLSIAHFSTSLGAFTEIGGFIGSE